MSMPMLNPYLLIELVVDGTCCRCHILMSNFVVDNVVQLVVLLLDVLHHVDVEFVVLNCCNPFLLLHLGDAHSGC